MAFGGSLSPGGSYGRAQVVIGWAQDNWSHFDSWCCVKNIDPIELPAYRFYNLALTALKETFIDADPEVTAQQLANLEQTLSDCDNIQHPLAMLRTTTTAKLVTLKKETETSTNVKPSLESRHAYIPPWYQGEEKAYQTAKLAQAGISALPKMQN